VLTIADRAHLLDLEYLGRPGHIASAVLETREGLAVVDPGPATTRARLEEGLSSWGASLQDVRVLLVTHIHLDHSGAAGLLAACLPRLTVYVHRKGADHLADPSRLIASAERIYGDRMDELWGEIAPVRPDALRPLDGGEILRLGDRIIETAYTPGHATHHLAFLDRLTGLAFTGDVAGECLPGLPTPLPVTPPPDISVEDMVASGDRILAWRPERLFVTHFGPVDDPPGHLAAHAARLVRWSERVRVSLDTGASDEDRARAFAAAARRDLEEAVPQRSHSLIPDRTLHGNWFGLARYWRKKAGGGRG
jgi:glyoxylase-like metal-dependent hydrolase (beta-lactamase superfamily II)